MPNTPFPQEPLSAEANTATAPSSTICTNPLLERPAGQQADNNLHNEPAYRNDLALRAAAQPRD